MAKTMHEDDFATLFKNEVQNAVNYMDTEYSQDRTTIQSYYMGDPFGNEVDGRSQVVETTVSDVVEFMMPSLMKVFGNGDFARCLPRGPEDVASAEQATDYLNFVLTTQNPGFRILHNWIKDALLFKMGVVKVYYEENEKIVDEEFEGLTPAQLAVLSDDDAIEIDQQESIETGFDEDGEPILVYNVKMKRRVPEPKICIDNVPPEEFLFNRRATDLESASFIGQRTQMTVSDLVEMGYDEDEVEQYAGYNELDQDQERQQRFEDIESGSNTESSDPTLREVLVTEGYIYSDVDGDGVAELRRVVAVGEATHVLENEPYDKVPFAVLSPILLPHRMVGRGVAEQVMDIQMVKSTIMRQLLDNLYLQNNSRVVAVEGQVNLDDLLQSRPGGIVRTRAPGMVAPLTVPQVGQQAFAMLEYMDKVRDNRTGMSAASMGLDPDVLQSTTASAVNATMQQSQAKVEMIARVFAETGMKDLASLILQCIVKYMPEAQIVRLRNEFVEMDPSTWATDYDIDVEVGLGNGREEEKMAMLVQIAGKQEQLLQTLGTNNPVVSAGQYVNTLKKIAEMAGFKDTQQFFNSGQQLEQAMAQQQQQQQQAPDPERQKFEAEIALKREKMQAEMALKQEEMKMDFELRRQELDAELALRAQSAQLGNPVSPNMPRA